MHSERRVSGRDRYLPSSQIRARYPSNYLPPSRDASPRKRRCYQERGDFLSLVKRHPIVTFFVLSYAISWAFLPIESVRFLPSGPLLAALIVIPLPRAGQDCASSAPG